jgi:serine/threonine protein kinase
MSVDHQLYCLADRVFFETPDRIDDHDNRFAANCRPAPPGWRRSARSLWTSLSPRDARLPPQGWKIHVSSTIDEFAGVLDRVWHYCVAEGVAFKFLRSRAAVLMANAKGSPRASSGKLITIYPGDDVELERVVTGLAARLAGAGGPYILSDLRFGPGPLYLRYGAFDEMYCSTEEGALLPAVYAPDGKLVPDRRGPVFDLPAWVEVPEFLLPHLAARRSGNFGDFPYAVLRALHFSNGGGIYVAKHLDTGREVVLREARPHAGIDRSGADAVARLHREHAALTRLAGLPCVPALLGQHVVWEHHFVAEEYVEGQTLLSEVLARYPLVHAEPTAEQLAEYQNWATDILSKVERAIAAVHARGLRFGDLHPGNVMVRPDGEVTLVDFELAADAAHSGKPALGAPGFAAPAGISGLDVDRYALECLRLFLFMPLTELLVLEPAKARTLHEAARSRFRSAPSLGPFLRAKAHRKPDEAAALFSGELDWPALRDSLVAGIHATATPDRTDRLFPGDPAQFATGGISLGSGAAGVLFALHLVGETVPDEYVDWLIRAAGRPSSPRQPAIPGGLYDGLSGVALVLDLLGRHDEARECLDRVLARNDLPLADLFSGRTGMAVNLLRFARRTGEERLREAAIQVGDELAALVHADVSAGPRPPARVGLMHGATGCALLFVRLFEDTGRVAYLDLAGSALRQDLAQCVQLPNGGLYLRRGLKNLPPYLEDGTGGIALVLREYLRYREDAELSAAVESVLRACPAVFVLQPGLHQGRAGLIALLSLLGTPADRGAVMDHVRTLGWHALFHQGHLVFPGAGLRRVSMDLATGSAGILLALQAAFTGAGCVVPCLDAETLQKEGIGRR